MACKKATAVFLSLLMDKKVDELKVAGWLPIVAYEAVAQVGDQRGFAESRPCFDQQVAQLFMQRETNQAIPMNGGIDYWFLENGF